MEPQSNTSSVSHSQSLFSFLVLLLSAFLILNFPLIWKLTKLAIKRKKNNKYHPVAGTIFHHLVNFRRLHEFSTDRAHKHKTFRLLSPLRSEVYTADPANVEYILKTNFSNYGKGEYNYCNMKDLLGDGIFAVDGAKWQHQRKVANIDFSRRILRDYSTKTFKDNVKKLAVLICEAAIANTRINIQDLLMKSTMDSIFQVAFGVELNCITASNREEREFVEAFDDASSLITWRYVDISWKIKKLLNIGCEAVLKRRIRVVDNFIYKMICSKIEQISKLQHDSEFKREDMLSRFLLESEKDPVNITHRYLRDIILNFMIAGKDTTAITLSWFFYMLCKNPHIEGKIAEEVMMATKEFGENVTISEFAERMTDEIINSMHYLQATLSETLRLYPAIPLDPKICFSDDTLPDGFNVREGDMVAYMPYAMARMKFIWGEDAEVFLPERWLGDNGVFSPESPFKFPAFQAGPRECLGKEFAYRQMKIFAAVLVRFFKFKLSDEEKPVKYRTMLTLQIDHGLHIHAILRK
ncbi:putative abieta-7,13-dien-18-ol hydroxylase [Dioscorea sansibarensis]